MTEHRTLRCAIYTRVSSDQGLEQDFNSLDAQREAAEAYIKSQAHEGWRLRRDRYDDGGFSGGTMERPALQRLLADVAERRIDIIVVYKVDRLTRSLADFAKLVEMFDGNSVSFVSVTQSFNTTSSMGRLTLNVLLSFAQFEREVTGERIRDKIAASKKKGIWMGGIVPLGYRVYDRKLLIDEAEAGMVRLIFQRYIELGTLSALQADLRDSGVRTRSRSLASGRMIGGVALTNGSLSYLLKNRMYLGEINHRGVSYKSDHQPILDRALFDAVQAKLAQNLSRRDLRKGKTDALLTGCIFDDRNHPMSPTHTVKNGMRYRYYVSTAVAQGRKSEAGSIARVPATEVERLVLDTMLNQIDGEGQGNDDFKKVNLHVKVCTDALELTWVDRKSHRADRLANAGGDPSDDGVSRRVVVPYRFSAHRRKREIILPASSDSYVRPIREAEQKNLVLSIAQGRAWRDEILAGAGTIQTIATREHKSERMIRMMVSLAFLDPRLVRAALHGALPRAVSTRRLVDAPIIWADQWRVIGLSRPD